VGDVLPITMGENAAGYLTQSEIVQGLGFREQQRMRTLDSAIMLDNAI